MYVHECAYVCTNAHVHIYVGQWRPKANVVWISFSCASVAGPLPTTKQFPQTFRGILTSWVPTLKPPAFEDGRLVCPGTCPLLSCVSTVLADWWGAGSTWCCRGPSGSVALQTRVWEESTGHKRLFKFKLTTTKAKPQRPHVVQWLLPRAVHMERDSPEAHGGQVGGTPARLCDMTHWKSKRAWE